VRTAVIDYGAGNLASVCQGLRAAGLEPVITRDAQVILDSQALILPGVGAFAKGMGNLRRLGLEPVLKKAVAGGKPLLGICLGMQLLFEESEEHGSTYGLGLLPGRIRRFPTGLKVPHMGWNSLEIKNPGIIIKNIPDKSFVYFVHSYHAAGYKAEHGAALTKYGLEFPSLVCFNNIVGMQFHPEKSSRVGLQILNNFGELVRNASNPSH
jgi:glutamine amidotransferase